MAAWPVAARAQQSAMPVIGWLSSQSAADDVRNVTAAFFRGLKETGYVESQNVMVDYRNADNQMDRLPALAADLVRRRVAVIVAGGNDASVAAKAATANIPIVFAMGGDPIVLGLVASLNRPGGNVTGSTVLAAQLGPKRMQLLRELLPKAARFGVLEDPAAAARYINADLQAAAATLGLELVFVNARTDSDFEMAFATFSRQHVSAILVGAATYLLQPANGTTRGARGPLFAARNVPIP
jgi:putative ABC transport system substrate-binding protein